METLVAEPPRPYLRLARQGPPRQRPSTVATYRDSVRRLKLVCGPVLLASLTPDAIAAIIAALHARGYAPSTIATTRTHLSGALGAAVTSRLLDRNPVSRAAAVRVPRTRRRVLTRAESERLVAEAQASGDTLWPFWAVVLHTGLRLSEARGIRWQDVDLDRRTLRVSGQVVRTREPAARYDRAPAKTRDDGDDLFLPLTVAALDALHARQRMQEAERQAAGGAWRDDFGGLVFTRADGQPLVAQTVRRRLARALARIGITERVRVHDLRHSLATNLLAAEVPLQVISKVLGHSSITVTAKTYAHVDEALMRAALGRLEAEIEP